MNKTLKYLCIIVYALTITATAAQAADKADEATPSVDWEPVMAAIIQVESSGRSHARNGNQCGAMQITPILVQECNNILKARKSKKRYTLDDRFSIKKSKEMFLLIQSRHNPDNNVEHAIRSWNGGQHYSRRATQRYYEKVMRHL